MAGVVVAFGRPAVVWRQRLDLSERECLLTAWRSRLSRGLFVQGEAQVHLVGARRFSRCAHAGPVYVIRRKREALWLRRTVGGVPRDEWKG